MSSEHPPLAVIGSIHGNEPFGAEVVRRLDDRASVIGHPEALAAGQRFLGSNEMGGLIPGDANHPTDPDMRAAGNLHQWLRDLSPWGAASLHCNDGSTRGSEFVAVGGRTTRSILAIGNISGHTTVSVDPDYPFYREHPAVIEAEEIVNSSESLLAQTEKWLAVIKMARDLGPDGMSHECEPERFKYYLRGGFFMLVDSQGRPNRAVLDCLEDLEQIEVPAERYSPLELPADLASRFGLSGLKLAASSWGYRNMSRPIADSLDVSDNGLLRREAFGGFYIEIDPPRPTGSDDELAFQLPELNLKLS